jgi:hypothetical protein
VPQPKEQQPVIGRQIAQATSDAVSSQPKPSSAQGNLNDEAIEVEQGTLSALTINILTKRDQDDKSGSMGQLSMRRLERPTTARPAPPRIKEKSVVVDDIPK